MEACSGLRYLFPLTSFAFFCAYIFRGRLWQKVIIFASAAPITIFMNAFRIAVTGVLVNRYGTEQAEGFLHYFEGWVIFVACIALLFLEMARVFAHEWAEAVGALRGGDSGTWRFAFSVGRRRREGTADGGNGHARRGRRWLCRHPAAGGRRAAACRPQRVPAGHRPVERQGQPARSAVLDQLKLTDYALTTYRTRTDPRWVELYVAYYDSQRKGASVHSPRACLPSGGWQIDEFDQHDVPNALADGSPLRVNRARVSLGSNKTLVYYWFMQRGRYLTNEFAVKWYIFWDSLTKNRTDGAMVRVTVPIDDVTDAPAAEKYAEDFIRAAEPRLYYQIPQEVAVARDGAPTPGNMLR